MKSVFSKVVTIWLTIVLLLGAVVGINVLAAGEEVATVDYKNVSYDGQIQLVYYVKSSVADAADGSYVKLRFWFPGVVPTDANTEGYEEKESAVQTTIKGDDYSLYFSGGILPKMMREDVYACTVRYAANGDVLSTGELFKFSVQEYVELRLAAGSTDAQIELYLSLLNYGAAVQEALDYKTDKLAGKFYDFEGFTKSEATGATKTITFYYDPATETYSATATGVEGEISYDITFVSGGNVIWDAVNSVFTMEKKHEIISVVGSDGSDTLTVAGVEYTAGDLIPWRTFLTQPQTDTGTGTRYFAGERPTVTIKNMLTLPAFESDLLYVFESTFVTERYSSEIGNVVYIHLMNAADKAVATTTIQHHWGDKVYYNKMLAGGNVPSETGLVTAPGDVVDVRIEVRRVDSENVSVCLIANGVETPAVTVPDFELGSIKFIMQDDGRDRNATVKMTNTNFIKYVPLKDAPNPYEPTTPGLPFEAVANVKTSSVWGVDNGDGTMKYYATNANGGTEFRISYKNTPDVVANSNGSVNYIYNPVITEIKKVVDGTPVAVDSITCYEAAYAGEYGVGDTIPHRWFLVDNYNGGSTRPFAASGTAINKLSSTLVEVPMGAVDTDLLYLFETEMSIDSVLRSDWLNAVFNVAITKANGTSLATSAIAKTNSGTPLVYFYKFGAGTNIGSYVSSNIKFDETFTYRVELRQTETAGTYRAIILVNGTTINTFDLAIADEDIADVRINFNSRDDSPYRYSNVNFRNLKWIKYDHQNPFEPVTNQFVPVAANIKTVSIWGVDNGDGTMKYYASNANGGTEYKISFKNNTNAILNADGSITLDNYARISAITTADGVAVDHLTHLGKNYGAGDSIPYRCFFVSTDPGSSGNGTQFTVSSPMFNITAESMDVRTDEKMFDFDLAMLLETQLTVNSEVGGSYSQVVTFNFKDTAGNAKAFQLIKQGGSIQVTPFGGGIYDGRTTGANFGDAFKLRIEVRKNADGKYDYITYVNDVKFHTSTHDNALDGTLNGSFRNDVADRSNTLTVKNFKFIKYNVVKVAERSELEVNTTGLATAEKSSGTKDTTIYYNSTTGAYSHTAADGYAPYVVTWKNGFDVVIAPDGAVTYVKAAEIVSIKDADGAEVTLPYGGKTYGAGDLIPRNNWFLSSSFDQRFDGVRFFEANMTFISDRNADVIDATSDKVDTSLHYVLETELTFEKLANDAVKAGIVQIINQTTSGGTGLNIILGRNTNDTIYIEANSTTVNLNAKLGESFTFRLEVRKNGSAFDVAIYVDGFAVMEYSTTAALRTQIRFDGYNYSASRNHSVTFKNFRHIAWNVTDAAE